jgi:hypothetical protein
MGNYSWAGSQGKLVRYSQGVPDMFVAGAALPASMPLMLVPDDDIADGAYGEPAG